MAGMKLSILIISLVALGMSGCGPRVENGVTIEKNGWFGLDEQPRQVPEMGNPG